MKLLIAAQNDEIALMARPAGDWGELGIARVRSALDLRRLMQLPSQRQRGLDTATVSVVLLDGDLEPDGGRGLLRDLMSQRPDLKIIWVTGGLTGLFEVEARRQGVHFIVRRPVDPALLNRVIDCALDHEFTTMKSVAIAHRGQLLSGSIGFPTRSGDRPCSAL